MTDAGLNCNRERMIGLPAIALRMRDAIVERHTLQAAPHHRARSATGIMANGLCA